MGSTDQVAAAAISFVGSHFLLSHPLRRPLVSLLGERAFGALYSVVALAIFAWLIIAYRAAPATELLWAVNNALWITVTVAMLLASILLMGSLIRNPALPTGGAAPTIPAAAKGVFAITRHPMMWAFALWGLCHVAVYPVAKNMITAVAMTVLALVGAAFQDHKKSVLQPELWRTWKSQTSYVPFAAIAAGRAHFGGFGMHAIGGGVAVWLAATWAHIPLSGWAAGIWRWF